MKPSSSQLAQLRIVLTVAALVAGAVVSRGYVIEEEDILWPDGEIRIHEQLGATPAPLLDGSASLNAAFDSVLDTWNQYLGRIQFVPIRNSTAEIADGNGINNVVRSNTVFGMAFETGMLAVTTQWYDDTTNKRTESDIIFNTAWNWNSYRGPLRTNVEDIVRVGLHQLGYTLGLGNPDLYDQDVKAIMNSYNDDLDTLQPDDVDGAMYQYGAAPTNPPAAPAARIREYRATTDDAGTASFVLGATWTHRVQFVDQDTGSPIAGAAAYLYADPNGVALVTLADARGRYASKTAPVQLPTSVPSIAATGAARPVQVPVPAVVSSSDRSRVTYDWIPSGLRDAWNSLQVEAMNRYIRARAGGVIVNRQMTLSELPSANFSDVFAFIPVVDQAKGRAVDLVSMVWGPAAGIYEFYDDSSGPADNLDRFWKAQKFLLETSGYASDQRFRVTIFRLPINTPEVLREYTEYKIWIAAQEEPRRPFQLIPSAPGVISGRMVDASTGAPLSGLISVVGPEGALTPFHPGRNGLFTSTTVPPGTYFLYGEARNYKGRTEAVEVTGDGKVENVTIRLSPIGVRSVVISPSTPQTIPAPNGVMQYRAVAYDANGAPVSPQPRFSWYSQNPAAATIDVNQGTARAVRPGPTRITAQADQVTSDAVLLTVGEEPCRYALSRTSVSVPAAGESVSVVVTTGQGCKWAARANHAFITVTTGSGHEGTSTVIFRVDRNEGPARTGQLTIAEQTVTVSQAALPCSYTLSRTSASVPAAGGSGTVTVTTGSACEFRAEVASNFLTVHGVNRYIGTSTVTFTALANAGPARTGQLTIAGQKFTVSQPARTPTPSPSPGPSPPSGSTSRFDGTYDFSWGTFSGSDARAGYLRIRNGVVTASDGQIRSGSVDAGGNIRFTTACTGVGSDVATWTGTMTAGTPKSGSGTWRCPGRSTYSWRAYNGR